jgi:3-hydroxyisobutyrate dehydrogenase-like beta-hydroxyacid dehydrogenase
MVLLHPGAMGVTVGQTLLAGGHRVRWCMDGRGAATAERAAAAGFEACQGLAAALDGADSVISVCPPGRALAVAEEVVATGFAGLYLDANAVSPDTARHLEQRLGDRLVDGGIIGPPALQPGTTRLYLSGPQAHQAAAWFDAGPLAAVPLSGPAGEASALKMCYAAYTKGSSALLLAVRALAAAEGVSAALLGEWAQSQAGLESRSEATARASAGKAWRFVDEMLEIAATFEAAGLPEGFHTAAADVYRRMTPLKDQPEAGLDDVLARLTGRQHPS